MNSISPEPTYATCIAIDGDAVLIVGPSGSGKSDLALRLIDRGAMLVSDDQTVIERRDGALYASAPAALANRIEIRGLGIMDCPAVCDVPVRLIVHLVQDYDRFPLDHGSESLCGMDVASVRMSRFESSAPIKVEWALRRAVQNAVNAEAQIKLVAVR